MVCVAPFDKFCEIVTSKCNSLYDYFVFPPSNVFAVFAIFSMLGHITHIYQKPVGAVVKQGQAPVI